MKSKAKKYIFLMLVFEMLFMATCASAAISYFNQTETFESDTADADPNESWYSYKDMGYEYANATSDSAYAGSKSYRINDSTLASGEVAYFNWSESSSYSYLEFYYKIDNTTHNESRIYIVDSADTGLARFDITVNDSGIYNVTYRNYTAAIWSATGLTNNTWYRLRWDFNYTTDQMRGRLFTSGGTALNDSWCPIEDGSGAYDYSNVASFQVVSYVDQDVYLYLDNIKLYKSYDWGGVGETTDYVLGQIIPILFAVFLLIVISGMALSGVLSIDAMIALMLAAIIGLVCLAVVFGLY